MSRTNTPICQLIQKLSLSASYCRAQSQNLIPRRNPWTMYSGAIYHRNNMYQRHSMEQPFPRGDDEPVQDTDANRS